VLLAWVRFAFAAERIAVERRPAKG